MWDDERYGWSGEVQEICPLFLPDEDEYAYTGCVRERCAWYVAERGKCAVKVIATK